MPRFDKENAMPAPATRLTSSELWEELFLMREQIARFADD
jgi:hypothetical protein